MHLFFSVGEPSGDQHAAHLIRELQRRRPDVRCVGFGGEAPILIRTRDGKVHSIAGVGTMPKLATADFFRARRLKAGEILAMEPNGLKGIKIGRAHV